MQRALSIRPSTTNSNSQELTGTVVRCNRYIQNDICKEIMKLITLTMDISVKRETELAIGGSKVKTGEKRMEEYG